MTNELYHYSRDLQEVEMLLEENGGEVTAEVNDKLMALGRSDVAIADNIYNCISEKDATIELCKAEIKRIQEIKRRAESTKETIKEAYLRFMLDKGIDSFKSDLHTMKVSVGRESVEVFNEEEVLKTWNSAISELQSKLPSYLTFEVKVNKTELGNAIKRGELIQGAEIVRNPSLLIK